MQSVILLKPRIPFPRCPKIYFPGPVALDGDLDLLALVKYFESKSFVNRATERGVFERLRELKWRQILMTIASLERLMDEMDVGSEPEIETLDSCYESLATVWS